MNTFPFGQRLRYLLLRIPIAQLARCLRKLDSVEFAATPDQLGAHFLAGGSMENVTDGMVAAHHAGVKLDWFRACAIDLAGNLKQRGTVRVADVVQAAVEPTTIELPSGEPAFHVTAPDRGAWHPRLRLTVVTALDRFIGGADIQTIEERLLVALNTAYAASRTEDAAIAKIRALDLRSLEAGTKYSIRTLEFVPSDGRS